MFERLEVQEGINLGGGEHRAGVAMDTEKMSEGALPQNALT